MAPKTVIFIPTYNERDNAPHMCEEIHKLNLDADVLFVDDNSPDGTGDLLEEMKARFPRLIVQHRSGKLGIGSAHFDAIQWAYEAGYTTMVTMDCDFTHSPADVSILLEAAKGGDVAVGSRWMKRTSLPGWNVFRRTMTMAGHLLTKFILGIPQDATGAFRVYNLEKIPREIFGLVLTKGYSFFFECLFILNRNGFKVVEVPIALPARTYGSSKMSGFAAFESGRFIFELLFASIRRPEQFLLEKNSPLIDASLFDPQEWDAYWSGSSYQREGKNAGSIYEIVAGIYRRLVIRRNLETTIQRIFPESSRLLHAGCGSGQVDVNIQKRMRITALDISPNALHLYARNNHYAEKIIHGSIFDLAIPNESFDGVYNLGVMEHFTDDEIQRILGEFKRVLKPGGKVVCFWPHARATSVFVLNAAHFLLNRILKNKRKLHPPEISLCRSKSMVREILNRAGFNLIEYIFGMHDCFVQAIIVAKKE